METTHNPAPVRFDAIDGESGRTLFRAPLDIMRDCSAQGPCDSAVAAALDSVETLDGTPTVQWVATIEELRRYLKGFGAWDDLSEASEETIRERALWCGAGDFRAQTLDRIKELRHDKKLGGPGLDSYVFNAATLCEGCGESKIDAIADDAEKSLDTAALESEDTDDCPVPSFFTETDSPAHCDECGELTDCDLTGDGLEYVAEAIRAHVADDCGARDVIELWAATWFGSLPPARAWQNAKTRRAILRALARVRRRYNRARAMGQIRVDNRPTMRRLSDCADRLREFWIECAYGRKDVRKLLRGPRPLYLRARAR